MTDQLQSGKRRHAGSVYPRLTFPTFTRASIHPVDATSRAAPRTPDPQLMKRTLTLPLIAAVLTTIAGCSALRPPEGGGAGARPVDSTLSIEFEQGNPRPFFQRPQPNGVRRDAW